MNTDQVYKVEQQTSQRFYVAPTIENIVKESTQNKAPNSAKRVSLNQEIRLIYPEQFTTYIFSPTLETFYKKL